MKKGFTLVEIIVCIVLLSLIASLSIINLKKNDNNDDVINDLKIEKIADIYFDKNEINKKIFDQNDELYIRINELIDTGLISDEYKTKYKDKCVHLIKNGDNLGYEFEDKISDECYDLPYIEPPVIEEVTPSTPEDLEVYFVANDGTYCYNDDSNLPTISFDYIANDATDIKVKFYIDGEEKNIVNNEYQIVDGDKNIKIVLSYQLDGELKEAIYYDNAEYVVTTEPTLSLVDNKISSAENVMYKKSLDNNIYNDISLDDLNNSSESKFYVEASNKCASKKYEVNIINSTNSIDYKGNNWLGISNKYCNKITVYFRYVFPNGNILYQDYTKSDDCGNNGNPYFYTYIYDPVSNTKIQLDDLGTNPDIKIEKINNSIFKIYM